MCRLNRQYVARHGWVGLDSGGRWQPFRLPAGLPIHYASPPECSCSANAMRRPQECKGRSSWRYWLGVAIGELGRSWPGVRWLFATWIARSKQRSCVTVPGGTFGW